MPDEAHFCEECGAPLTHPAGAACACGAAAGDVDEEGFCGSCGVRREPRARDHFGITVSEQFAAVSDKGQRHHRNEDFVSLEQAGDVAVLVACDGVSSTRDPDKASEAGAHAALRSLAAGATIRGSIALAQKAVAKVAEDSHAGEDSPAATVVAATVQKGVVSIGWLGDSRAYFIGADSAEQLTTDHSWFTEAIASGQFSEEEAARNGNAHAITRWLGADAPDDEEVPLIRYEIKEPGWLLLCTDGLWNYAPETESMADLVRNAGTGAAEIAENLVRFANAQGGHDNITAALLAVDPKTI